MVDDEGKPNRERPYGAWYRKIVAGVGNGREEAITEQAKARDQL